MKKILLFGATGFVGKNMLAHFKKNGYRTVAPDIFQCNLLDFTQTREFIKKTNPDFVINGAFWGGVTSKLKYSNQMVLNNISIVTNILKASRLKRIKKIIHFGSGHEYADSKTSISEMSPIGPQNTYATIKAMTSVLSTDLARDNKLPLIIIKPFNLYGPYDTRSVIFYLISSILNKKKFSLTDGKQIRDYLYIDDFSRIIEAIVKSTSQIKSGTVYNIGSGHGTKIKDIFETIFKLTGFKGNYKKNDHQSSEYWHQVADIKKISRVIKIPKLTPYNVGVEKTIAWIHGYEKQRP